MGEFARARSTGLQLASRTRVVAPFQKAPFIGGTVNGADEEREALPLEGGLRLAL